MSGTVRQAWIVSQLPLRASDRVLELGCGHGVAASVICDRLDEGTYLGIDRSATMVAAATKRNQRHVSAGRARFDIATVTAARLDGPYDWVVAIHFPPIERGDPTEELAAIRDHIQPGGRLAVGFQPVDAAALDATIRHVASVLSASGFAVHDTTLGSPDHRPAAVVPAAVRRGLRRR